MRTNVFFRDCHRASQWEMQCSPSPVQLLVPHVRGSLYCTPCGDTAHAAAMVTVVEEHHEAADNRPATTRNQLNLSVERGRCHT